MKFGISTYAFLWQWSDLVEKKLSLKEMIKQTKEYGGEVFQICDYPPIEKMGDQELQEISLHAKSLGIELELGTRGVHPSILNKYLNLAKKLDVKLVRSMMYSKEYTPDVHQAIEWIQEILPLYEQEGVTIALETYEQIKTEVLVDLVEIINSPNLGICLDPANSIASLETPNDVVQKTSSYVVNLHIKDFKFTRNSGWVGFYLGGAPLGEGQLDFRYMMEKVLSNQLQVNAILELWLNFQENIEKTIMLEKEWIAQSMEYLRRIADEVNG